MSNPQQPPADGWQPPHSPPQQEEQPVYRPNEQPPGQEPPPWSPESQQTAHPGQQPPMEDEGTVKYSQPPGHPSQPQAPFGPPPGVPVSPFDAPPPGVPASGIPASGMPAQGQAPGMPPVSSVPASGMPVSPGQGQFGPQGGQLVPVSSGPGGQPWGGAQPGQIQRKKKKGGRGPLWILLIGIAVIAGALGVGGFILFNPDSGQDDPGGEDPTVTIEKNEPTAPELAVIGDEPSGLSFTAGDEWVEDANAPAAFTAATGVALEDGSGSAYIGMVDAAALGIEADAGIGIAGDAFDAALATHLEGELAGDSEVVSYRIDARVAEFRQFQVGDVTVLTALVETDSGYAGFAGFAGADQVEAVNALRTSLSFGE